MSVIFARLRGWTRPSTFLALVVVVVAGSPKKFGKRTRERETEDHAIGRLDRKGLGWDDATRGPDAALREADGARVEILAEGQYP